MGSSVKVQSAQLPPTRAELIARRAAALAALRETLSEQGRTKVWLAGQVSGAVGYGISVACIRNYLSGRNRPTLAVLEAMCRAIGLPARLILAGAPEAVLIQLPDERTGGRPRKGGVIEVAKK